MENVIRQALRKPVNLNLKEATLQEIARTISDAFMISVEVDRVSLDDLGIDAEATYDLSFKNISLGNALKSFLEPHDLTYAIANERLLFTISDYELTSAVIYDVSDLLAVGEPQRVAVVRRGLTSSSFDFEQLIDLIELQCAPEDWQNVGGPGWIQAAELNGKQLLIVTQTEPAHEEVEKFLQKLRKAGGLLEAEKAKAIDNEEPVVRVYPLQQGLKSNAEEYLTLIKTVIKHDWRDDEKTSTKAIANTLVVTQPEAIQVKILGLLTDLDVLLKPSPSKDFPQVGGLGAQGGFFNIQ